MLSEGRSIWYQNGLHFSRAALTPEIGGEEYNETINDLQGNRPTAAEQGLCRVPQRVYLAAEDGGASASAAVAICSFSSDVVPSDVIVTGSEVNLRPFHPSLLTGHQHQPLSGRRLWKQCNDFVEITRALHLTEPGREDMGRRKPRLTGQHDSGNTSVHRTRQYNIFQMSTPYYGKQNDWPHVCLAPFTMEERKGLWWWWWEIGAINTVCNATTSKLSVLRTWQPALNQVYF